MDDIKDELIKYLYFKSAKIGKTTHHGDCKYIRFAHIRHGILLLPSQFASILLSWRLNITKCQRLGLFHSENIRQNPKILENSRKFVV